MNLNTLVDALLLFALLIGTAALAAVPVARHSAGLRLVAAGATAALYVMGVTALATRYSANPLALGLGTLLPIAVVLSMRMPAMQFVLVASSMNLATIGWLWAERLALNAAAGGGIKSSVVVAAAVVLLGVSSRRWFAARLLALPMWLLLVVGAAAIAAPLTVRYATNDAFIGLPLPGGITVQPAELGRVLTIIWLARRISADRPQLRVGIPAMPGQRALPPAGVIARIVLPAGVGVALGALSNDYGPAFLLALVALVMLAVAGMQRRYLLGAAALALTAIEAAQLISSKVQERFAQLSDPIHHGEGLSQVGLGIAALSRGGWLGLGLGQGLPATVPRAGDDMLMAALAEELGGLAICCCVALVGIAFLASMHLAKSAGVGAAHLAVSGLAALQLIQSCWAAGGNLGLVPLTGIPFPLLAISGSSLLMSMVTVGLRLGLSESADVPDTAPAIARRINTLTIVGAGVLALVLATSIRWVSTSAITLVATKDARATLMTSINRGALTTRDGVVIAATKASSGTLRPENASRTYPAGPAYAAVVGIAARNGYRTGLEAALTDELRCTDADRLTEGSCPTVALTLDSRIQEAAYQALAGRTGAVVVTDVATGSILAYVSHDAESSEQAQDYVRIGTAMPGSVAKLITATAALEAPRTPTPAQLARFEVGGQVFTGPGGAVCGATLEKAIAESCNPYFAQLGQALGTQQLALTTDRLLNTQTRVAGMPITTSTLTGRASGDAGAALGAVGLGDAQVTPLAMASLVTTIARHGKATCLRLAENGAGDCSPASISKPIADRLQHGMSDVVTAGTARGIPSLVGSAGKTGTADRGNGLQNGWFIGYAPANTPTIAIAVLILPTKTKPMAKGAVDAGAIAGTILQEAVKTEKPRRG